MIGGALDYRIYSSTTGRRDDRRREVPVGRIGPGDGSASAGLLLTAGQNTGPGRYDATFELRLIDLQTRNVLDRRDVTAIIDVDSKTAISVVGLQPRALRRFPDSPVRNLEMDFGELETGEDLTAYVQVRSNGPYALSLESRNGGALAHETSEAKISYEGALDGAAITLTSPQRVTGGSTDLRGRQHALRIRIGDVTRKPAGAYADEVTLTVVATY